MKNPKPELNMYLKEFKEDHSIIMACFGHSHVHIKISITNDFSPHLERYRLTSGRRKRVETF